jgi:hypothetical protein
MLMGLQGGIRERQEPAITSWTERGKRFSRGCDSWVAQPTMPLNIRLSSWAGGTSIEIYTDSELIANQMKGVYTVRNERLRRLHREATELLNKFRRSEVIPIRREENREADRLANEAIDGRKVRG